MRIVKSKNKDLEQRRTVFFQFGLIITLTIVLAAFEWKTATPEQNRIGRSRTMIVEEDLAEITVQKKKQPEMPRPVIIKKIVVELEDLKVDDEDLLINAEVDDDTRNDPDFSLEDEIDREEEVFQPFRIVEEMPSFPGGEDAMFKYLGANIQYPSMAVAANIKGTVHMEFVIDPAGVVTNVVVVRGIGGGCDEEAARVIRGMPRWNPGKQRGIAVPVRMTIPVKFHLR